MQITRTHVSIDLGWQQRFVTGKHCITQSPGYLALKQTLKKQLNLIPFWPAVHRFLAYEDLAAKFCHSSLFIRCTFSLSIKELANESEIQKV